MKNINSNNYNSIRCPNCGAPVTSEICQYCNSSTGLNTGKANMEYPVINCKEANIGFWTVFFPMIFALSFGSIAIIFQIMINDWRVLLFTGIFGVIAIVALILTIIPIIRHMKISKNGKSIEATVYGYMDDNILLNGVPAQIVKLLINTTDGKKFILYKLGTTKKIYKVNSIIKLKVFKDNFFIENDDKTYF